MKPEELQVMPEPLEKLYYDLQNRIIQDIARRINKAGDMTSTAEWQMQRLKNINRDNEYVRKELAELTNRAEDEIDKMFEESARKDYRRAQKLYVAVKGEAIPYEESEVGEMLTEAIIRQTKAEVADITRSLGFSMEVNGKREYFPIARLYHEYTDNACMSVASGAFDYNSVLRNVVNGLANSGVRTVVYGDTGHVNRAPVAVRRAVMTGMNQLTAQISQRTAFDLGAEYYEVTAHIGARPSHAEWQGQVYKISGSDATHRNFEEATGYGTGDGLCGWNCRHSFYPFFPDISTRAYTDKELKELYGDSVNEKEFAGKMYSGYQATQKQRQYETTMRAQRANIHGLVAGGADKDDVLTAKARYLNTMRTYKEFSKAMDIPTQMERVYIDGLGRVATGAKRR